MAAKGKGSIILKVIIVILVIALFQVLTIPGKIWSEQDRLTETSRANMNALYEAQRYHYSRTKQFVPADSLSELLDFLRADSLLLRNQAIGRLTNQLNDKIQDILSVPALNAMVPITQSLYEINGDLSFNTRYFRKYDDLLATKEEISDELSEFTSSSDFSNFAISRMYVDSLIQLTDRIDDFSLENSTAMALRYADTLNTMVGSLEKGDVSSYWGNLYVKIGNFTKEINKTDLATTTSVADRLRKFIDRINTAVADLDKINLSNSASELSKELGELSELKNSFEQGENAELMKNFGQLQLNEVDSVLFKFNESNFTDPDDYDGKQRYIVAFTPGKPNLTIEDPNLLDSFQKDLISLTSPIKNLAIFPLWEQAQGIIDSTIKVMDENKTKHRFNRYDNLILDLKETIAELNDFESVLFVRYLERYKTFVDTIQSERRFSVLEPMIEDVLNPMDTLATRFETRNLKDLEKRLAYLGDKVQRLDSLVAASKIPARSKRTIPSFYESFQQIMPIVEQMKTAGTAQEASQLRSAAAEITRLTEELLNGVDEPVYYVFNKRHVNQGYIQDGVKSWEEN